MTNETVSILCRTSSEGHAPAFIVFDVSIWRSNCNLVAKAHLLEINGYDYRAEINGHDEPDFYSIALRNSGLVQEDLDRATRQAEDTALSRVVSI